MIGINYRRSRAPRRSHKNARTTFAGPKLLMERIVVMGLMPTNISTNSAPLIKKNGTPA
ncbi:hypothetical protein [Pseudomonas aeruginosa]|uniref:hypothetical protein n=1 Tax=Pseudomonas aeruginosa TaxID=287 RepID=UPI000B1394CA|nr:hypothetical protein [Pseudomonas aeruginosa]MDE5267898.1 hypothetical protein [Pseudomonas aeruginosa]MDE5280470.1 hypothetical protein [Pseudomonas aeruginosa]